MAEIKLNTSQSIVDYLKSQGKDSSFSSRKSLYESSGLGERLGPYTGSSAQNTAFLKQLQSGINSGAVSSPSATPLTGNVKTPSGATVNTESGQLIAPPPGSPSPATPSSLGFPSITATEALASIPGVPSADEILGKVFSSPSFQNFAEQQNVATQLATGTAEAEKLRLQKTAEENSKNWVTSLGRRGLFFSGETGSGLQQIAEELAASTLNVDRVLAGTLLESDLKTKEKIIEMVGDLVKEAQEGRTEALSALEKVGLTVIGNQVVPTLAARREQRQLEAEERLAQTAAFNQEATLARLELSASAAERAEAYLRLAEARAASGGAGSKLSISDVKALGLPVGFVGMSEDTVIADLSSSTPPAWFVESANQTYGGNLLPEVLSQQWDDFRADIDARLSGDGGNLF